jgi:hypothetical protein
MRAGSITGTILGGLLLGIIATARSRSGTSNRFLRHQVEAPVDLRVLRWFAILLEKDCPPWRTSGLIARGGS